MSPALDMSLPVTTLNGRSAWFEPVDFGPRGGIVRVMVADDPLVFNCTVPVAGFGTLATIKGVVAPGGAPYTDVVFRTLKDAGFAEVQWWRFKRGEFRERRFRL